MMFLSSSPHQRRPSFSQYQVLLLLLFSTNRTVHSFSVSPRIVTTERNKRWSPRWFFRSSVVTDHHSSLPISVSSQQPLHHLFLTTTGTKSSASNVAGVSDHDPPPRTDEYNNPSHGEKTSLLMMSQLLDQALVLRLRVVHATTAPAAVTVTVGTTASILTATKVVPRPCTWQWLLQQLDESIIPYLIQQYRSISSSSSSPSNIVVVQQQLDHYQRLFHEVTTAWDKNCQSSSSSSTNTVDAIPPPTAMTTNETAHYDSSSNHMSYDGNMVDAVVPSTTLMAQTVPEFDGNDDDNNNNNNNNDDNGPIRTGSTATTRAIIPMDDTNDDIDVIIVGSGLSGLCAGAILNTVYHQKVVVLESHAIPGGCAHAFTRRWDNRTFTFDSGPSILLGCSTTTSIPNALQQVLQIVRQNVTWIPYSGWNMIERTNDHESIRNSSNTKEWTVSLGPTDFIYGPLYEYGGASAVEEFYELRNKTQSLTMGAAIPAMSMRAGPTSLVPLVVRHFSTLLSLIQQGETVTGTFAPYMDGPIHTVKSPWLRNWLDALAFSLSGLPASRTAAAAMAFVLQDMHRSNATLDYPKGGMGEIVNALIRAIEQGPNGSKVYVNQHVESIDGNKDATKIMGVTLRKNSQKLLARNGVICNAPVWSLRKLIHDERILTKLNMGLPLLKMPLQPPVSWNTTDEGSSINFLREKKRESQTEPVTKTGLVSKCETIEMTASFIHLHIALNATGLNLQKLAAHYTVMDRSLSGDPSIVVNGVVDGPCGISNMIAVSNPCVLDPSLAPEGYIVIHAYGAGNEPYEIWEGMRRNSPEYIQLKEERAQPLWRAVECIIPDVRNRVVLQMIGTPLTHERFLRRPRGTYGSVTEDYLRDGSTTYRNLLLASDSVFPGIGVPAVAIVGASAANSMVSVLEHLTTLQRLEREQALP